MFHGRKAVSDAVANHTPKLKTPIIALVVALAIGISISSWLFSI